MGIIHGGTPIEGDIERATIASNSGFLLSLSVQDRLGWQGSPAQHRTRLPRLLCQQGLWHGQPDTGLVRLRLVLRRATCRRVSVAAIGTDARSGAYSIQVGAGAWKRGRLEPRRRPNPDGTASREDEPVGRFGLLEQLDLAGRLEAGHGAEVRRRPSCWLPAASRGISRG
jgi:hypothetical protein